MEFTFKARRNRRRPGDDAATFRIDRLWRHQADRADEVSHLVDRTYAYQSQRELRWHLAERFEQPVTQLQLEQV